MYTFRIHELPEGTTRGEVSELSIRRLGCEAMSCRLFCTKVEKRAKSSWELLSASTDYRHFPKMVISNILKLELSSKL